MKPHKHCELIKAWADGAKIQFRPHPDCGWCDCPHNEPSWHDSQEYRIKPEPVTLYVNEYEYGVSDVGWKTLKAAQGAGRENADDYIRTIKLMEVEDDS